MRIATLSVMFLLVLVLCLPGCFFRGSLLVPFWQGHRFEQAVQQVTVSVKQVTQKEAKNLLGRGAKNLVHEMPAITLLYVTIINNGQTPVCLTPQSFSFPLLTDDQLIARIYPPTCPGMCQRAIAYVMSLFYAPRTEPQRLFDGLHAKMQHDTLRVAACTSAHFLIGAYAHDIPANFMLNFDDGGQNTYQYSISLS